MHLWDHNSGNVSDFRTQFSFTVVADKKDGVFGLVNAGDGFAFFIAPYGSKLPTRGSGRSLALLSGIDGSSSPTQFVAVEFDTFKNEWDPNYAHVGIDLNSLVSNVTCEWDFEILNGQRMNASISYVYETQNLSVVLVPKHAASAEDVSLKLHLHVIVNLKDYLPEWVTFGFSEWVTFGFSGSTGDAYEIHKIQSWEFSSSLQVVKNDTTFNSPSPNLSPVKNRKENSISWLALVYACGMLLILSVLILGLVWFVIWIRKNVADDQDFKMAIGPRKFTYGELKEATDNFHHKRLLGQGGFGQVYHGYLIGMKTNIAVKKFTPRSQQGTKEYLSEIKTISRLRHRNLVELFGWCREKEELLIVYEFVPMNSLDHHLFRRTSNSSLLTWENRYKTASGLASALFYLQENCEQCVLHRDIKSSNVLLDQNFNAKLGDFGLARLIDHGQASQTTSVLLGTAGYVAPEYQQSRKAGKESDIYSFGVVILEIACGKKATEEVESNGKSLKLVEFVWELYGRSNILEAADPRMNQKYDIEEMKRLLVTGLACANPIAHDRPSIRQVIGMLNFKTPLLLPPPRDACDPSCFD